MLTVGVHLRQKIAITIAKNQQFTYGVVREWCHCRKASANFCKLSAHFPDAIKRILCKFPQTFRRISAHFPDAIKRSLCKVPRSFRTEFPHTFRKKPFANEPIRLVNCWEKYHDTCCTQVTTWFSSQTKPLPTEGRASGSSCRGEEEKEACFTQAC